MRASEYFRSVVLLLVFLVGTSSATLAQFGSAGSIRGTVVDQTGGVIPDAVVEIHNPISGYRQTTKTDANGEFLFLNIPRNRDHLSVSKEGFQIASQDVDVRSSVPIELKIALRLKGASETVTVEAGSADLLENTPTAHTDVDRNLFSKMPLESVSSSISSLITLPPQAWLPIPMASCTGWVNIRKTSFQWTDRPLPTSKAKLSPTRFRSMRCNLLKPSMGFHRRSMATRPP